MTIEISDDLGPSRYRVDVVDPAGDSWTEMEMDDMVSARLCETLAHIKYLRQWPSGRFVVLVIDQEDGRLVTDDEEVTK